MADPVRYYSDQHYYGGVDRDLRRQGIDVLTAHEAGRCGLPDVAQLAFTAAESRVTVTFGTDYLALHNAGAPHAVIVWCPATKYGIGQLAQLLGLLHGITDAAEMRGRVEYL